MRLSEELLQAWQEMDRAAMAIQVAQPSGMTAAAAKLEEFRRKLRGVGVVVTGVGNMPSFRRGTQPMTTLNRRAFCKSLHRIMCWNSYDIYAEYDAVRMARELLRSGGGIEFVTKWRNKGTAKSLDEQVAKVNELLSCTIDESFPLKAWRYGKLQ